jgi:hypothetical protein
MERTTPDDAAARTRAVLVDAATMIVTWLNDAAAHAPTGAGDDVGPGVPVERAVPMVEGLGVAEAIREVAETGGSRTLRADLISGPRGSVALLIAIHRVPSGEVLVLIENAYVVQRGEREVGATRRQATRRKR